MSTNEHLLDNFSTSDETKEVALHILRLAHAKTGPGSGRELRNNHVGLPAACILIACEQLNTTEVTKKSAQSSSCLNSKEFKKVYETVKAILDQQEKASNYTYEGLHADHKTGLALNVIQPFILEVENEVLSRGYSANSNLTKCAVYFWVLNCIKSKALSSTEAFASNYELSLKKFIEILSIMNEEGKHLRKKIQTALKGSLSPTKASEVSTVALDNHDHSLKASTSNTTERSPMRRSSRAATDITLSPTKRTAPLPWKKATGRELPNKDSPKRQLPTALKTSIDVEMGYVPETPSKRRKLESPSKQTPQDAFMTALATPGSSRVLKELSPKKAGLQPTRLFPQTPASTLKRKQDERVILEEGLESSDDSELGHRKRGRSRPVYLEQQQWSSVDPRIAKIQKQIDKMGSIMHKETKNQTPSRKKQAKT